MAASHEDPAERIARNQATFREINDGVNELFGARDAFVVPEAFRPAAKAPLPLLCECGSVGCLEQIALTHDEYRHVRENPMTFAVCPGEAHVFPDVERVVAKHQNYWIVEKKGIAGEIARAKA